MDSYKLVNLLDRSFCFLFLCPFLLFFLKKKNMVGWFYFILAVHKNIFPQTFELNKYFPSSCFYNGN